MSVTWPRILRRIARDRCGVAAIEFAISLPIILSIGIYGAEMANFALMHMKVSQIALNLADNASRVGVASSMATQQLREYDIDDVLQAVRLQGKPIKLVENGRVTLSSLEADANGVQSIHWQRCLGMKTGAGYGSSYGTASATDGSDTNPANDGVLSPGGMGDPNRKVQAPPSSGVMFVEINYDYQPLFSTRLLNAQKIKYIASFIVRDRRDFAQVYNPEPKALRSDCSVARA